MSLKLSLGQRIGLAFFALLTLFVIAGGVGLYLVGSLRHSLDDVLISFEHMAEADQLETDWQDIATRADAAIAARQSGAADIIGRGLDSFDAQLGAIQAAERDVADQREAEHEALSENLLTASQELRSSGDALQTAIAGSSWGVASSVRLEQARNLEPAFTAALTAFRRDERREVDSALRASQAAETRVLGFWRSTLLIMIALAILLGAAITRSTLAPIRSLIEQMRRVSNRDFTPLVPSTRRDEIGELSRAFAQLTEWLRDSYQHLQQRVDESTHDLELAAEVGLAISHMRDIGELLAEAVDLIRSRYDLYYVQIYLTDETGLSLSLHAGTGIAGEELARAGQQLTIGPGSTVGLAAARRSPVVVPDTSASDIFRPNPLLPHTRSDMAMPLQVGDEIVGVLNLQSSAAHGLTEARLPAFGAIAGQLASAIQNARLFSEVETARYQLARQAKRSAREGWKGHLDGIEQPQHLVARHPGPDEGTTVEIAAAAPSGATSPEPGDGLARDIAVSGQAIGRIRVLAGEQHPLPADAEELVGAVADQVAQRVESLRLLAQADRFRREAEAATRHLTYTAWADYLDQADDQAAGYLFDGKQVQPLPTGASPPADALTEPLRVRDAEIGVLAASGVAPEATPFARQLLSDVAARLARHLENIRLAGETERALAESQRRNQELALINQVVASATSTLDLNLNLRNITAELVRALQIGHAGIALLDETGTSLTIVADASAQPDEPSVTGTMFPLEGNELSQEVLRTRKAVVLRQAQTNPRLAPVRDTLRQRRTETLVLFPVVAGSEVIGTLGLDILEPERTLSPDELRLVDTVMRQAATAIRQSSLFHQLQQTLERTEALYAGSSRIIQARTPEDVLAAVVESTMLQQMDRVEILLFDQPWVDRPPDDMHVVAGWSREPNSHHAASGARHWRLERLPTLRQLAPGRPRLFQDLAQSHPDAIDLLPLLVDSPPVRGLAMFPVTVRGQWVGILTAQSAAPLDLNEHDVRQIRNLTGQAATVTENLRLFEKTESALAETAILFHMSGALNAATSLKEMLRAVATSAITPGVEAVELLLLEEGRDGEGDTLLPAATWLAEPRRAAPVFAGRPRWEADTLPGLDDFQEDPYSALLIDDCQIDPRLDPDQRSRFAAGAVRAAVVLPLRQGQHWLGFLVVSWPEPRRFAAREWRLYSGFANQAAITLSNLKLLSRTRAQARRERILREVTERVRNASDVDTILRLAAQEIGAALGRPTVVTLNDGPVGSPGPATNGTERHG